MAVVVYVQVVGALGAALLASLGILVGAVVHVTHAVRSGAGDGAWGAAAGGARRVVSLGTGLLVTGAAAAVLAVVSMALLPLTLLLLPLVGLAVLVRRWAPRRRVPGLRYAAMVAVPFGVLLAAAFRW